jgi:hypothetical protein
MIPKEVIQGNISPDIRPRLRAGELSREDREVRFYASPMPPLMHIGPREYAWTRAPAQCLSHLPAPVRELL